jgi:hypothetical protein
VEKNCLCSFFKISVYMLQFALMFVCEREGAYLFVRRNSMKEFFNVKKCFQIFFTVPEQKKIRLKFLSVNVLVSLSLIFFLHITFFAKYLMEKLRVHATHFMMIISFILPLFTQFYHSFTFILIECCFFLLAGILFDVFAIYAAAIFSAVCA